MNDHDKKIVNDIFYMVLGFSALAVPLVVSVYFWYIPLISTFETIMIDSMDCDALKTAAYKLDQAQYSSKGEFRTDINSAILYKCI